MTKHLLDLHDDDRQARVDLIQQLVRARQRQCSQAAVANRIGCSDDAVSVFETQPPRPGRQGYNPNLTTVQAYARAIGYQLTFTIDGLADLPDDPATTGYLAMAAAAPDVETAEMFERSALLARMVAQRKWARRSQRQMAETMGCSESAVTQVEADRNNPRLSTFQRYVRALGGVLRVDVEPVNDTTLTERQAA